MKKFLALAAVVCMATFAQALQVNWTSTEAVSYPANCTVSLVYVAETNVETAVKDVYQTAILEQNLSSYGKADNVEFHLQTPYKGYISMESADVEDGRNPGPAVDRTYYVFLTDNTTNAAWGATFEAVDTEWFKVNDDPTTTVTLNFKQVAVPEPTVLALLALGVAGMVLRRKVA